MFCCAECGLFVVCCGDDGSDQLHISQVVSSDEVVVCHHISINQNEETKDNIVSVISGSGLVGKWCNMMHHILIDVCIVSASTWSRYLAGTPAIQGGNITTITTITGKHACLIQAADCVNGCSP